MAPHNQSQAFFKQNFESAPYMFKCKGNTVMSKYRFSALLLAAGIWWGSGSILHAQEVRATVGGRVTDPQGAAVPNASVTVVSDDTDVSQRTRTNNQGSWTVEFLLPGHYHFLIAARGFKNAG